MNRDLQNGLYRKLFYSCLVLALCLPGINLYGDNAPVTSAGVVTTAVPGSSVTVPVSVSGFTNIGRFTLTMRFDITRIQYVSASPNSSLSGMSVTYTAPSGNNMGILVLSWTGGGTNVSLASGSSLANLTFSYTTGTGFLEWRYIYGYVCLYERYVNGSWVALDSSPQYQYFVNGGISNRTAPVTHAPGITAATPGALPVPVTVNGFTNIGSFTLYLEYDSNILTYAGTFTKNSAFSSGMVVGSIAGSGSKKMMVIQWYGNAVNLAEGATLVTLDFTYSTTNGTSSALTWFDNGPSCEYTDPLGDRLIDIPSGSFYFDGSVAGGSGGGTSVYLKVFLQGGYNASTHTMRTDLNTAGYLPLTQPYSGSPLNYSGTESVTSFNSNVVDWVVIELRTGTAASTQVARQAALLLSNGTVVGTDQTSAPVFSGITAGNAYYVLVYHRNHLPVMTASAITLPNTVSTVHDFTTNSATNVYSLTNAGVIALETGVYGQIAGELVYDNRLIYSGPNNDKGLIFARINSIRTPPVYLNDVVLGYYPEDLNMDGIVRYSGPQNDQGIIFSNIDVLTDPTVLNSIYLGQVPVSY